MRASHEAIDRALATEPDPQRALMVGCGLCSVTVPFHSASDLAVILERKERMGGCIFAGHRICRLKGAQIAEPTDHREIEYVPLKMASYRLGKSARTVLRWATERGAAKRFGGRWLIAVEQLG